MIVAGTYVSFTLVGIQNPKTCGETDTFDIKFSDFSSDNIYDSTYNDSNTVILTPATLAARIDCDPDAINSDASMYFEIFPTVPIAKNDIIVVNQANRSTTDNMLFDMSTMTEISSFLIPENQALNWSIVNTSLSSFSLEYLGDTEILNTYFEISVSGAKTPQIASNYYLVITTKTKQGSDFKTMQNQSISQLIASVPDPPKNIRAAKYSSGTIEIFFDPPEFDGLAEITSYTARPVDLIETFVEDTASPIIMNKLTNGYAYFIEVVANNRIGSSQPGVSNSTVTPASWV